MFWFDASIRFNTPNLGPAFNVVIQNGGVSMFSKAGAGHSTFAVTDPKMWQYLVTDPEKQKLKAQYEANSILIYRTERIVKRVLIWHILCALDRDCIAPRGSQQLCGFTKDPYNQRHGACHRYDQSAINTLLSNLYNFMPSSYVPPKDESGTILIVKRRPGYMHPASCR
jgi:hypothetical protein